MSTGLTLGVVGSLAVLAQLGRGSAARRRVPQALVVVDKGRITAVQVHPDETSARRARRENRWSRTAYPFTEPETPFWVIKASGTAGYVEVVGRYGTLAEAKRKARYQQHMHWFEYPAQPTVEPPPTDLAIFRLDATGGTRVADLSTTFVPRITDPREGSRARDGDEHPLARWAFVTARGRKIHDVRVFTDRDDAVAARAALTGRARRLASVHRFILRQPVWLVVVYDKGRQPFVLTVTWSLGVAKASARTTYQSVLGDPADIAIFRVDKDRAARVVDATTGFVPRITDDAGGSAAREPGRWLVVVEQFDAIHSIETTRYGWQAEQIAKSRTHWGPLAWKTWERGHVVPIPGEKKPAWVVISKQRGSTWDPPAIFDRFDAAHNAAIRRIGGMRRGLTSGDDLWIVRVGAAGTLPKIVAEKRYLPEIPRIYHARPAALPDTGDE